MIREALRIMWNELRVADDFRYNWYTWAAQQMAHVFIGIVLVLLSCMAWMYYSGEMPVKGHLFIFLSVLYGLWELALQGLNTKNRWDSLEDFFFVVVYGSGATLTIFSEIEAGHSSVRLDAELALPFLLMVTLHLLYGSITRIWGAIENGR